MSMRITTNMIRGNYQKNLNNTMGGLEIARRQAATGRRVAYTYEDPSASAKGAILERRYARNQDYTTSAKNALKWMDAQEAVLDSLNEDAINIAENYSVSAVNDPSGDVGREAYAAQLRELQRNMIFALNNQYGDAYIMAGNDGMNPPFEMSEDGKHIYYRGVDVDTGLRKGESVRDNTTLTYSVEIKDAGPFLDGDVIDLGNNKQLTIGGTYTDKDGNTQTLTAADASNEEILAQAIASKINAEGIEPDYTAEASGTRIFFKANTPGQHSEPTTTRFFSSGEGKIETGKLTDNTVYDYSTLDKYSNEKVYIDLGFGMKFDANGEVIPSSAFDSALPGINIVGYGKSSSGLSNNMMSLVGQMADVLEADEFDREAYEKLWMQFKESSNNLQNQYTNIGAKYNLVKATEARLEKEADGIEEQYKDAVGIDEALAIKNYSDADYMYNVALKIGSTLLGQSLLDFIN
ncbi:MAG: hypothetical protein HFE84_03255 [Lachnospiraceae bacterium]|nr:hypothetical protein [Lachnospiraceae bacterium]